MLKFFTDKLIRPVLSLYLRKERSFTYKGFSLRVFPGIFHPAFFFSTRYVFSFIEKLDLRDKQCLEIGCGSGLLSLLMSRKKGIVTAIDVDQKAVKNTLLNFQKNRKQCHQPYTVLQSDLFDQLPIQSFDVIVINPPYFFKAVSSDSQYAWNCGPDGEYFDKLFSQLPAYIFAETKVYMVLADNCDIERIRGIAASQRFRFELKEQKKILWETNFIYAIAQETNHF